MTQRSAREARIHLISEGVIASYIHDISSSTAVGVPAATAEEVLVPLLSGGEQRHANGRCYQLQAS